MRKILFFSMLIVTLLLVACGEDAEAPVVDNQSQEEDINNEDDQTIDDTAPTELADVFAEMVEATNDIESVKAEIFHISTSKVKEDTFVSEYEITSNTIIDPYTQHVDHKTISGEGEDGEIYFNDNSMYVYFAEDGWFESDNFLGDFGIGNAIKESDINHFHDNVDLFELNEEEDYFLITYNGPDGKFDDIFSNIEITPTSLNGLLGEMSETVESTGEIEIKVDKETFLINEYHYIAHSKDSEVPNTEITDNVTTVYIYNKVDTFEVPQNVMEEAETLEVPN